MGWNPGLLAGSGYISAGVVYEGGLCMSCCAHLYVGLVVCCCSTVVYTTCLKAVWVFLEPRDMCRHVLVMMCDVHCHKYCLYSRRNRRVVVSLQEGPASMTD